MKLRHQGYLRTAVRVLMKRNPNPYDGEPLYNLALALKYQGRYQEAYNWFYKSTWNAAWQDAGYFACAQISLMQGRTEDAMDEIERSLIRNTHNHKARALKAVLLIRQGRTDEACRWIAESLAIDPFNFGCLYERCLLGQDTAELVERMRDNAHNYDEIALDYCAAGCWREALGLWNIAIAQNAVTPMTYYYIGWCKLCDPMHPALHDFPTAYYSDYQWWDAMTHSGAINVGKLSKDIRPMVRVIDDWVTNRSLALLFEVKVGKGKLLVSGIDFHRDMDQRPAARQLLYSLGQYMQSDAFHPQTELSVQSIRQIMK